MGKNIAIIINDIKENGAARVVSNLSLYLEDENYRKIIITTDGDKRGYSINGELINLSIKGSNSILKKFINTFKRIKAVKNIKKKEKISTTISFLPNPNLVNVLSKNNDKIIISVRNYMSKSLTGLKKIVYKTVLKKIYNRATLIVAVSESIKEDLIKNFGIKSEKIKVIYNFYNIEQINKDSQEEMGLQEKKLFKTPTIITTGRMSDQKGQWHLIRAFKKVKEKIPTAQLILLGSGELEEYLKKMTNDYNLNNSIHFLGFKKNPFKYIKKADVFVLPSLFEGFPNALCEAMACGLPIISADCQSGPREILEPTMDLTYRNNKDIIYGEYGILTPSLSGRKYSDLEPLDYTEKKLTISIIELLNNQSKQKWYSKKSIERVKYFQQDKILRYWKNIII